MDVNAQPARFLPGIEATWRRKTIHDEVCPLLLQSLPIESNKGRLDIVKDKASGNLNLQTRLTEIKTTSKLKLEEDTMSSISDVPYLQLSRLEKLVHTDHMGASTGLRNRLAVIKSHPRVSECFMIAT